MEKNILKDKLNLLLKASLRIFNLHKKLVELEVNKKETSNEFLTYLDYLDLAVESYEELLIDLNLSLLDHVHIYKYFNKESKGQVFVPYYFISNRHNFKNVVTPIYKLSEDYLKTNILKSHVLLDLDFSNILNVLRVNKQVGNRISTCIELESLATDDLVKTMLFYIDKFVQENNNHIDTDNFIKAKYYLAFSSPNIHHYLRENNFNAYKPTLIDSIDFYAQLYPKDNQDKALEFKRTFFEELLIEAVEHLSTSELEEFDPRDYGYEELIIGMLIKSCVINLDLNNSLSHSFLNEDYRSPYDNSMQYVQEIILEALSDHSKEPFIRQAKPKIIIKKRSEKNNE